jgi:hypothetical protein
MRSESIQADLVLLLIKESLAHLAHPVVSEETRERGTCSGCGTITKTLTAPRPNIGHGYRGPMYCLPCNPRFGGDMLDAQWSALERMGS